MAAAWRTAAGSRSRCSARSASAVGADYIVGIRITGDEHIEDGLGPEECVEIARLLVRERA